MKVSCKASSDVALIKYWGKKDEKLRLPENGSISMILDGLDTVTTVEFSKELKRDEISIQGESDQTEIKRVIQHLDRIRNLAGMKTFAKVVSQNTFPKGTGLSSSGSGFAALTVAGTKATGLDLTEKQLSILARQGSGTACRCVCGGFVEWKDGNDSDSSFSETIFPSDYVDIRDVIAIVDEGKKKVSSTEGHSTAQTSPFFSVRQKNIREKIEQMKIALKHKDFSQVGSIAESEALEFHSILLTSSPAMIAWYPGTIEVMLAVQELRKKGVESYFTINTGFNVHVLTLPEYQNTVQSHLQQLSLVKKTLTAKVGNKPEIINTHLF